VRAFPSRKNCRINLIPLTPYCPHFEARLSLAHGNLFALPNIVFGLVVLNLKMPETLAKWVSCFTLAELQMPFGMRSELYLGLPPYMVVVGGTYIFIATVLLAVGVGKSLPQ